MSAWSSSPQRPGRAGQGSPPLCRMSTHLRQPAPDWPAYWFLAVVNTCKIIQFRRGKRVIRGRVLLGFWRAVLLNVSDQMYFRMCCWRQTLRCWCRAVLAYCIPDGITGFHLEADRISFSLYFSAPENAFFYFSAFYFSAEKDIRIFVSFFFGTKMAVKKSVLWLRQYTAGRTLSHLQSHTATVYIATHRAWVLWGSKHWAVSRLSLLSLLLQSACVSSPSRQKFFLAPPTSSASEQLFSAAGQTYSDRRSSLLEENAEKLLLLVYNIRLFDFKYWSLHTEQLTQWAI